MYEYFYGEQSNQFSFYRIPKILFTDEAFKSISPEAKILYGILLDRMSLSQKNGWTDDYGRVYIVFTVEERMSALGCQNQKANKLMYELEKSAVLLNASGRDWGNQISYMLRILLTIQNHTSRNVKITLLEM